MHKLTQRIETLGWDEIQIVNIGLILNGQNRMAANG